jgi:DNA-directed RNA polymerase specialized sigma24 family protein
VEAARIDALRQAAIEVGKSARRRDKLIREAVDEGLSYREISAITGLTYGRIGQIVRKHS